MVILLLLVVLNTTNQLAATLNFGFYCYTIKTYCFTEFFENSSC